MKRTLFLLAILVATTLNISAKGIYDYQVSKFNVVADYSSLVGEKVMFIPPVEVQGITYGEYGNWEGFGKRPIPIVISNIKIKKNNSKYTKMLWTLCDEYGRYCSVITVYVGNYTKYVSNTRHEYFIEDLPLYYLDYYLQANSSEVGTVFTNPKVKASYKVVGLSYANNAIGLTPEDGYQLAYVVKNSISGEEKLVAADGAKNLCFKDDLAESFHSYLSKVEKPSDPSVRYGKTTTITEDGITKYTYIDDYIDIVIMCGDEVFNFALRNASTSTIKIIWDEATFVGYDGRTSKIVHSGINYSDIGNPQLPTSIIKGAIVEEVACPTANISYNKQEKNWDVASMYPPIGVRDETAQVSLMLPIQIEDVINEYVFVFNIKYGYDHPERLILE